MVGLTALELWHTRRQAVAQGERAAATLAHVLAEQTARTVQAVDLTLLGLRDALAAALGLPADDARFRASMRGRLEALPYVRALFAIGPDGFITHDTDYPATPRVGLADRPYFRFHQENADPGLHAAEPLVSRSAGVWFVSLSRRIDRPDGGFGGLVVAAVEPRYFERFYGGIDVGPDGVVALLTRAGVLVARHPDPGAAIGRSFADAELFRSQLAERPQGVYWPDSPIDGAPRVYGYRVLHGGVPLVVLAGLSERLVLGQWRTHARAVAAAAAALATLVVALAVLTRSNLNRLEGERARLARAEAALRVGEERLRLAVEGTGIGTFDLDPEAAPWCGRRSTSPSSATRRDGTAWPPARCGATGCTRRIGSASRRRTRRWTGARSGWSTGSYGPTPAWCAGSRRSARASTAAAAQTPAAGAAAGGGAVWSAWSAT